MSIVLGIESTAHTFGIGVVKDGKILANVKDAYTTKKGGIIPLETARHHKECKEKVYKEAVEKSDIDEKEIDAIAISQGPGLAPCLLEGMKFAKKLSSDFKKPLVPVNHCIAHLEIGKTTGAKDPVMLYASGANTQIIAYNSNKYRIFGETLDIGVGNFIDTFARYAGLGFPGGPEIEKLAENGKSYIELPYKVKGMDVALSGILTNLKQKLEKINLPAHSYSQIDKKNNLVNIKNKLEDEKSNSLLSGGWSGDGRRDKLSQENFYSKENLAYSLHETVFAMLVEVSERAMAHLGKNELLLGGGVGCNKRLQEMCRIMCEERNAKFFVPEKSLLVDNGAMIAFLGEIMFNAGIKFSSKKAQELDIKPRQRTDDVEVNWKN
ncbi:MAG: tRNA (adenosine(37)-N6)-threonylcarbamoyltransferase complex transferase subunit TsaD [Nanoarchaeota archaeon]